DQDTPANLSAPRVPAAALVPKARASPRWSAASTFAQKCPARAIRGHVADSRLGQNSTSGGARDTAAQDRHAHPPRPPSSPGGPVLVAHGEDGDAGAEVAEHLTDPPWLRLERRGREVGHGGHVSARRPRPTGGPTG